jgi:hypothetical protein
MSHNLRINLKHIDYLVERVLIGGDTVGIIHIYSEYPDYKYVPAVGEGIACVDDAARASIAYLMHYEKFKDKHSLEQAKLLLKFIFKMQAEDGGFYNFIYDDLSINKFGQTSNNESFKWWACRALWAMGYAYNMFSKLNIERDLRDSLALRIEKTLLKAIRTINKSDVYERFIAWNVPARGYWLLENGTDASAEAVLGASLYYEISRSETAKWVVEKLCKAISTYQFGDESNFPFCMHPSFTPNLYIWHSWGSRQSYALLVAGRIFNRQDWIESAIKEIDYFYRKMLFSFDLTDVKPYPQRNDQINYGITPIVQAFIEYGNISGDTTYKMYGGLYASWWLGNNIANHPVYDSSTGRFYDAVRKDGTMNLNAGAESVVEGLIGLQTVLYDEIASKYVFYRTKSDNSYKIIEAENFNVLRGRPKKIYINEFNWAGISGNYLVELRSDDAIRIKFNIDNIYEDLNLYTIYVQYRKKDLSTGHAEVEFLIDSTYRFKFDMSGSSSGDYIWIDKIDGLFPLSYGEHIIDIYPKNLSDFIWIDYFIIQPLTERKVFVNPDGVELKIERRVITGIGEDDIFQNSDDIDVYIFPNPFNREVNMSFKRAGNFKVQIFDICGRKVLETLVESKFLKLNLDDISSGLYFCLINDEKFSKVKKLIMLK